MVSDNSDLGDSYVTLNSASAEIIDELHGTAGTACDCICKRLGHSFDFDPLDAATVIATLGRDKGGGKSKAKDKIDRKNDVGDRECCYKGREMEIHVFLPLNIYFLNCFVRHSNADYN